MYLGTSKVYLLQRKMMIKSQGAYNKSIFVMVFMMFFFHVLPVAQKSYYEYTNIDNYVKYYSVEPVTDSFALWSNPIFKSTSEMKQAVDIMRVDVLFCQTKDWKYGIFATYISQALNYWPSPLSEKMWVYWEKWPDYPSDCYLKSNQKISLPLWVERTTKTIESWVFSFR